MNGIIITRTFLCKKGEEEVGVVFGNSFRVGRPTVRFGTFENNEFHETVGEDLFDSLPRSHSVSYEDAVQGLKEEGFEEIDEFDLGVDSSDINDFFSELCLKVEKKVPWWDNGDVK